MFKTFGLVGMKDKRILATRKIVEKDFFIKRIIAHAKPPSKSRNLSLLKQRKKSKLDKSIQSMQPQPKRQAVLL